MIISNINNKVNVFDSNGQLIAEFIGTKTRINDLFYYNGILYAAVGKIIRIYYKTILHYAAAVLSLFDVETIANALPALIKEKDYFGNTPYDIAVLRGDDKIIQVQVQVKFFILLINK